MANENATNRNQKTDQEKGKAVGAGATGDYQRDQRVSEEQLDELSSRPSEVSGQGGGVQGTGQSQSNPGGYAQGQKEPRDDAGGNQGSSKKDKRP